MSTVWTSSWSSWPIIEASWKEHLAPEFERQYFADIKEALVAKKHAWEIIYPPGSLIFNAFALTPFDAVKIVILGQDPYHGVGQAHGLSFSVPDGIRQPPSLQNIFKEIIADVGGELPMHGNLTARAEQGVLLLNAILTVTAAQPASHQDIGWQHFTDAVIRTLSDQKTGIVFMLRWNYAKSKKILIDTSKHLVLEAPHPSPYSAHSGFFGCKHFSKANAYLEWQKKSPIRWLPL